MNGWRIFSRMSGVVLESSSANARFPRHDQLVDRGFGLRAYLFSGKIIIPGDIARMETSESSFDLRSGFQVICRRNPASTEQNEPDAGGKLFQKVQSVAYNRRDVAGMAAVFGENGVRITPASIFRGRDAIGRELQRVIEMGLHDDSVRRTVSRLEGQHGFQCRRMASQIW
jgi:hypothetical protein